MKNALRKLYEDWSDELIRNCPELLGEAYSNPYYIAIPYGWEEAQQRIMIVGEEGHGEWGCGKAYGWKKSDPAWTINDIEKIHYYNDWALSEYTKGKMSPFWRRFKKIKELGFPCVWNNLDKIHYREKRDDAYHLNEDERSMLHSTPTKVLQKEIEILKPTVVVFFGWYYDSLVEELPDICAELYPGGKGDDSLWKYSFYTIKKDNITYIFTYHPGWRKNKPKDYEDRVMDEVKQAAKI